MKNKIVVIMILAMCLTTSANAAKLKDVTSDQIAENVSGVISGIGRFDYVGAAAKTVETVIKAGFNVIKFPFHMMEKVKK